MILDDKENCDDSKVYINIADSRIEVDEAPAKSWKSERCSRSATPEAPAPSTSTATYLRTAWNDITPQTFLNFSCQFMLSMIRNVNVNRAPCSVLSATTSPRCAITIA